MLWHLFLMIFCDLTLTLLRMTFALMRYLSRMYAGALVEFELCGVRPTDPRAEKQNAIYCPDLNLQMLSND